MNDAVLDQSARVKRVSAPVASPGCCALCGKPSHDKGFAETENFSEDFFGTIYFCYDCVGDYARIFGYMSRDEISDLIEKQNQTDAELVVLREAVANLENILDAYSRLRGPLSTSNSSNGDSASASEVTVEGTDQTIGEQLQFADSTPDDVTGAGEGEEPAVNKPADVEGRNDVHDTPSTVDELFTELGL